MLPGATPVARPVLLTVANVDALEFHVTECVRFCVLPSLSVPVAVNCLVAPVAIVGLAGVTASDTSTGATRLMLALAEEPL